MTTPNATMATFWPDTARNVCRAAYGNEKGPRWRAFLTVVIYLDLADVGGVTVVRAELFPVVLVTDE